MATLDGDEMCLSCVYCQLCGGAHEVIGTIGGVDVVTCKRVRDLVPYAAGVSIDLSGGAS